MTDGVVFLFWILMSLITLLTITLCSIASRCRWYKQQYRLARYDKKEASDICEGLRETVSELRDEAADLTTYKDAIHSYHPGYDPESDVHKPVTPYSAIEEMLSLARSEVEDLYKKDVESLKISLQAILAVTSMKSVKDIARAALAASDAKPVGN